MRPRLVIAPGREAAILRRHPWIFSGAVKRIVGNPQEGDIVDVVAADGTWLAAGHYQNESIVCKVLTFDAEENSLTEVELLRRRLQSAIDYRRRLGFFDYLHWYAGASPAESDNSDLTNVFRLVHAEGDYLPGLVCDWYNGVLVMQAHSVGMHRLFSQLVEIFRDLLGDSLLSVFDKSNNTVSVNTVDGYIYGKEPEEWEITESGNRLLINFFEGQKTGFFVDQRENRRLVQSLAAGQRVLNCFGYTGGFSLAALRGGAEYVETVDISRKAIELCNRNVSLNFGADAPHKGTVADVLTFSSQKSDFNSSFFILHSSLFTFIILDPPAFAKNHHVLKQGLKGYRTINQRAMEIIQPGGLLMTFSCSQAVSVADFRTMVFTAAANAGRRVRIVRVLPHAMDHPVSVYHPEGEYLKGLLLEVE
ncbi:MAG: class I SAM-dependent rRNA methyltransferase [Bacteroidales bacterium]|nr:class I SAM-dependent rRNA methyltransferase [Bacteroidales bacterium]